MALRPEDVANKQFAISKKRGEGYDESEVDAFLDEIQAELGRLTSEVDQLRAQLEQAPKTRDSEEAALRTLLIAQRTADETVAEARTEADKIAADARARAEQVVREAQEQASRVTGDLDRKREQLEAQIEDLRAFEREYRTRLTAYLESQLAELSTRGAPREGTPNVAADVHVPSGPPREPDAVSEPGPPNTF